MKTNRKSPVAHEPALTEEPDDWSEEPSGEYTTAEEAMDAATSEDGQAAESAYTPAPGLQEEPETVEDDKR